MLEGSTTSKTTLRTSLVLTWFEDSPHSNQSFDKTIGSTTDHGDQTIKMSSIFNTHTHTHSQGYPLAWTKSNKLPSSNSPSCCLAQPTSSGVSDTDSWRRVVYKNPTRSRAQHNSQGTTWWYFREDIQKSKNYRYVIKLTNNLTFQARWCDQISKDWHNPNSWSKSAPGKMD